MLKEGGNGSRRRKLKRRVEKDFGKSESGWEVEDE